MLSQLGDDGGTTVARRTVREVSERQRARGRPGPGARLC